MKHFKLQKMSNIFDPDERAALIHLLGAVRGIHAEADTHLIASLLCISMQGTLYI